MAGGSGGVFGVAKMAGRIRGCDELGETPGELEGVVVVVVV
jgi:hypothetical protein